MVPIDPPFAAEATVGGVIASNSSGPRRRLYGTPRDLVIGMVFAVEGLASLHVKHGQAERAAQLFAWADAMRAKMGDSRPPVEQASIERDLEVIHSSLNNSDFAGLSREGQMLTVEEAVALALENSSFESDLQ